jgi:hypothetical protein
MGGNAAVEGADQIQGLADLTNAQFPMLNSHPMRIENWELSGIEHWSDPFPKRPAFHNDLNAPRKKVFIDLAKLIAVHHPRDSRCGPVHEATLYNSLVQRTLAGPARAEATSKA